MSLLLLALVAGSLVTIMTGILGGTRGVETRQDALSHLETLLDVFGARAKESWPDPVNASGEIEGFLYEVDDSGPLTDPLEPAPAPFVDLRRIRVRLFFTVQMATGKEETRSYEATFLVSN